MDLANQQRRTATYGRNGNGGWLPRPGRRNMGRKEELGGKSTRRRGGREQGGGGQEQTPQNLPSPISAREEMMMTGRAAFYAIHKAGSRRMKLS